MLPELPEAKARAIAAQSPTPARRPRLQPVLARFDSTLEAIRELVVAIAPQIDELDAKHRRFRDLIRALDKDQIAELNRQIYGIRTQVSNAMASSEKHVSLELNLEAEKFGEHADAVTEFFPELIRGPSLFPPANGELLYGALLTTAVSTFEVFIAGIFTEHYRAHPEAIDASERKFSLADLRSFPTIAEAEAAAIADRVDQHMRAGLEEWSKWFSKALGCKVEDLSDKWPAIEEIFQRRHLIVHSGGRVTAQYLAKTPGSRAKLDRYLTVGQPYLTGAIDRLSLLGHMLAFEVQIKWQPKDSTLIASRMLSRCYRALIDKHWSLAERIGRRALGVKPTALRREMLRCNAWLAAKRQRRLDEIRPEIEAWDTSAMDITFELAKHCLLDDLDRAFALVPAFLSSDNGQALAEWPIFEELRVDPRYRQYIRKRAGKAATMTKKIPPAKPVASLEPAQTQLATPSPEVE
jgi:hypothetical protein